MSHWHEETLPEKLPESPMELAHRWFRAAIDGRIQPNPDAMVLATADRSGNPSARVVLCKQLVVAPGYLVFFTNYDSRKGRELTERPSAAAVFHWDTLRRQMRAEGTVVRSPDDESDEYFAQRAWQLDQKGSSFSASTWGQALDSDTSPLSFTNACPSSMGASYPFQCQAQNWKL